MAIRFLAVTLLVLALLAPSASALDTGAGDDPRDCGGRVDWGCNHETSPHDHCGLYLDPQGTGDGQCVLY